MSRRTNRNNAPKSRYTVPAVCGLLVLAVALVFGQTVRHPFVNYDDALYVSENPALAHGLTLRGIGWALTTTYANFWHPLTWLSLLLDSQFYGLEPWGYHLTNVLLHAATTVLLFLILWRMTANLWPSAFVAALFAIHPLHVESVAWVAQRKDVLSGLFFMLTIGAYLGYVRHPFSLVRYLIVVVVFAMGLMAKPVLVTLPILLLLLDYWPLGRIASWGGSCTAAPGATVQRSPQRGVCLLRWLIVEKIPLMLLAAAFCVATPVAEGEAVMPLHSLSVFPPHRQWLGFLRGLCGAVLLAHGPGGLLSPSGKQSAPRESRRRRVGVGVRLAGGAGLAAAVPLSVCRLVLVSGHSRADDRFGADRITRQGRPLHLRDADRAVHRPGVGRSRPMPVLAASPLGVPHWLCPRAGRFVGVRLAADDLLARQRGTVDPRFRVYGKKLRGPR